MPQFVALLRGINVGTAKRIAMADLRDLFGRLGYSDVRTLLNSGNVIFGAGKGNARRYASAIERALADEIGIESKTVVLAGSDFLRVVEEDPLLDVADNPSRHFVAFVQDRATLESIAPLAKKQWGAERIAVGSRAAYLWCPPGAIDSALMKAISKQLGEAVTTRNWATAGKIAALLSPP